MKFKKGDRVYVVSRSQYFGTDRHYGTVVTGNVSMRLWEGIGRGELGWQGTPKKEPHLLVYLEEGDDKFWLPTKDIHLAK